MKQKIIIVLITMFTTLSCTNNHSALYYAHERYKKSIITPATENNYVLVVNDTVKREIRLVKCLNLTDNEITEDFIITKY